jgi:alpha-1,2-mannosyltransferase
MFFKTCEDMQKMVEKINHLLNPTRLRYPWIIGAALWGAWILSIVFGKGNTDMNGHLVGTDFAAFYTAGKIILMGQSAELYNLELAHTIQQELYPEASLNFYPYLNPPHYALWMAPFALIPYPWAPLVWILLGLACLWLSIKWLGVKQPTQAFLLALTWLPVFYAASFGQNSFFSLAIFSLTFYFWKRQRNLAAGLVLSLLCYKPQFLLGIGLLWLLDWRTNWKALLGLGLGCLVHLGLNLWLLPEASLSYLIYAQKINANLMNLDGFPMWNATSTQAFWLALLPGSKTVAQIFYLACALVGLTFFFLFWKKAGKNPAVLFSAAVAWLVLTLPYLMIYDWTILLIPVIILYDYASELRLQWRATYAILWLVTFLSSAITFGMLSFLPFAIQISVPALWIAVILAYRSFICIGAEASSTP